jgi:type IV pilus assembly protein PilX
MKRSASAPAASRQQGVAMFVTLIALVLLAFGALTLLRAVGTGTFITSNLAFQEAALMSGDAGTEAAITWLKASSTGSTLFTANGASGYYATSADGCDLTGTRTPDSASDDVNWTGTDTGDACNMNARVLASSTAGVAPGYTVAYVINRMCNAEGDPNSVLAADGTTPMACSWYISPSGSQASSRMGASYGNTPLSGSAQRYYRITTRVSGPRNTVRYVQAFVML